MRIKISGRRRAALLLAVGAGLLAMALAPIASRAADTGTLKLRIANCSGGGWLEGAQIDVVYYRPGEGQIGEDSGNTDTGGYVEFTYKNLESEMKPGVMVTPEDETPDSGHTYYWISGEEDQVSDGAWNLAANRSHGNSCSDTWYDQENDVIKCFYNE